jgi:hypothetical protein
MKTVRLIIRIKVLLLIAIFSITIVSCNESKKKDQAPESSVKQSETIKEEMVQKDIMLNNDWIHDISLDKETKWKANIETTQGINAMLNLIEEYNLLTIEDYHQLANKLNNEKNIIIKECSMKGPSHDNLHIFLLPLIEKIDYLLTTTSIEEGSKITASIKDNLNFYQNYFN